MSARNPVADAPRDSALERRLAAALTLRLKPPADGGGTFAHLVPSTALGARQDSAPSLAAARDPCRWIPRPRAEGRGSTGTRLGRPLYAFQRVGSTMDVAKALAEQGAPEGTLVWAARQDRGRGRWGRAWESPEGGAYFSLILRQSRPPAESPQLSLVAGLAAAEAIKELTKLSPSIRWPNDLLLGGKKVAGILTESSSVHDPRSTIHDPRLYVVLGIGVNVTTDPCDLPETATSLQAVLGPPPLAPRPSLDPAALSAALCREFEGWYDLWTAQGFAPIRAALRPWLHLGSFVRLSTGDSQVEGQATDVDEEGRLLVRLESGVERAFEAGEVTLLR